MSIPIRPTPPRPAPRVPLHLLPAATQRLVHLLIQIERERRVNEG